MGNKIHNDSTPLVTIVTPTFNQGNFIEETIRSVVEQDYPRIEYWIIDGKSTDGSLEIIKRCANKYQSTRWISESDNGQSQAINKGFKKARGEIVAWLNSDDTYRAGAIRKAVDTFASHPEYKLIYGDAFIVDGAGHKTGIFPHTEKIFNFKRLVLVSDYISQPTVFFKREIFQELGFLDEKLHWCMDWDFWIRVAKKYPMGYVPFFMANQRDHPLTKTRRGGWKRFTEIARVIRRHSPKKYPPAYIIYGLGTLMMQFSQFRWLKSLENLFFFRWLINNFIFKFKYLYSDNWVSKEIEFIFFGQEKFFCFSGFLLSQTVPFRFEILVNGRKIHSGAVEQKGEFYVETQIPGNILQPGRNSICIKSLKTFLLDRKDRRKVSFKLINYAYEKKSEKIKEPMISIITPVSGENKYLEEAIQSVALQDYPHKEHLIVIIDAENAFSEIKKETMLGFPFVNWAISENPGESHAVNMGIKMARGDIISWLPASDRYGEGILKKVAEFFQNHPREFFLIGDGYVSDGIKDSDGGFSRDRSGKKFFLKMNKVFQSTAFWRREIHQYVGYFSEYLNYSAEFDFQIRVSNAFRMNEINGLRVYIRKQKEIEPDRFFRVNQEILNIIHNHYGTISWQWAFRFGNAYAGNKLKSTNNFFLKKVVFKCLVFGAAVYKKIFFYLVLPLKNKGTFCT